MYILKMGWCSLYKKVAETQKGLRRIQNNLRIGTLKA